MNIGIIGFGVVGQAIKIGFEKVGHRVFVHDIKLPGSSLERILDTEVCFLCVPTPSTMGGKCDTSIVEAVVGELHAKNYPGLIVIKSTVTPGTTKRLAEHYRRRIVFCPEFLREREAVSDFVEHHDVCIIGAEHAEDVEAVRKAHDSLPKHIVWLSPIEAELSKYFSNVFNALRIVFANEFFEVCRLLGADYAKIKNTAVLHRHIDDWYLGCNENFRGFGGVCLPKDTEAFAALVNDLGLDLELFDVIMRENKKFKTTVPNGMRPASPIQPPAVKPKKILITGGAGFIGFHLVTHLLTDPANEIVLIDNLQRGKMDEDLRMLLERHRERLTFITADLTDPSAFAALATDFDQVYHLAAVNGTKWFYEMPDQVLRINTLSLLNVLEWISSLERKPKLCFPSSNEAYAGALASFSTLPIPTPEDVPLVISDPYNPRWSYGATKLIGEQFVIHYAARHRFNAVIVRPHNFYGPRAGYDHVIPEFAGRILSKTDPFPIFGADDTRTFCYITDAVRAMALLMDSPATNVYPVPTVHIGATDEIRMSELAERMFRIAGWRPFRIEVKNGPEGSVKRRLADITKIKRLVGWEPQTPLDEGLRLTLDWYAKHPKT